VDKQMHGEVDGAQLRAATLDDVRAVASWVRSARECELWAGPRLPFPLDVAQLPARIDFSDARSYALWSAGRLVGFGQIVPKSMRRAHLARIIVAPDARRLGHGERLIRLLVAQSHAQSLHRVSLNVERGNEPAIALYTKLGFREAHRPADEPDAHGSRYMERASKQ
jgi:[ribosomal protein S18]-alanine N-acetyltransferase